MKRAELKKGMAVAVAPSNWDNVHARATKAKIVACTKEEIEKTLSAAKANATKHYEDVGGHLPYWYDENQAKQRRKVLVDLSGRLEWITLASIRMPWSKFVPERAKHNREQAEAEERKKVCEARAKRMTRELKTYGIKTFRLYSVSDSGEFKIDTHDGQRVIELLRRLRDLDPDFCKPKPKAA